MRPAQLKGKGHRRREASHLERRQILRDLRAAEDFYEIPLHLSGQYRADAQSEENGERRKTDYKNPKPSTVAYAFMIGTLFPLAVAHVLEQNSKDKDKEFGSAHDYAGESPELKEITASLFSNQTPKREYLQKEKFELENEKNGAALSIPEFSTAHKRAGESRIIQITNDTSPQYLPKIHGNAMVWVDGRNTQNSGTDIYALDAGPDSLFGTQDDRERIITTNQSAQLYPQISGNRIVWEDWEYNGGIPVDTGIRMNDAGPDGLFATQDDRYPPVHSDPGIDIQDSPSIDGNRVIWKDKRNPSGDEIYMKKAGPDNEFGTADDREIKLIGPTAIGIGQNSLHIKGGLIVWVDLSHGDSEVYVMEAGSDNEFGTSDDRDARITSKSGEQVKPKTNGTAIVWEDREDGNLYLMEPGSDGRFGTGDDIEKILGQGSAPSFSGNRIAFQSRVSGNQEIYLLNSGPDGLLGTTDDQTRRITNDTASQQDPDIDGTNMVWTDMRNGNPDIYFYKIPLIEIIYRPDTNETTDTNDTDENETEPEINPDGHLEPLVPPEQPNTTYQNQTDENETSFENTTISETQPETPAPENQTIIIERENTTIVNNTVNSTVNNTIIKYLPAETEKETVYVNRTIIENTSAPPEREYIEYGRENDINYLLLLATLISAGTAIAATGFYMAKRKREKLEDEDSEE